MVQVCSVTTESELFMPSFKFSVFCDMCLIKYANLECISRIDDNTVRELFTLCSVASAEELCGGFLPHFTSNE